MIQPKSKRERDLVFRVLEHVVEGLGRALGTDTEVVLHDVQRPGESVVAIANGAITGRRVGSAIISGPYDDAGLDELLSGRGSERPEAYTIISGYQTRTRSGKELESTSLLLRDEKGRAYAALCINADRSKLKEVQRLVDEMLAGTRSDTLDADTETPPSVDMLIQEIIHDGIRSTGKAVAAMSKEDKKDAVRQMDKRGLFLIRSSVDIAASSLSVSRFTIYNYLDEIKRTAKV